MICPSLSENVPGPGSETNSCDSPSDNFRPSSSPDGAPSDGIKEIHSPERV